MPITITTKMAEERISKVAEKQDKVRCLAIKDIDLLAKKFKYQNFCHKEFTRKEISSEKQKQALSAQENVEVS